MAAILERDPVLLSTLQPSIPALVHGIVNKCLAKNPDDRWQGAADLAAAMHLAAAGSGVTRVPDESVGGPSRGSPARGVFVLGSVALAGLAVGWIIAWRALATPHAPSPETRFDLTAPAGANWSPSPVASTAQVALSPDGRRLAFVATPKGGRSQIWIRPLDSLQAQPLASTDGGAFLFWSPDSRSIAFFADGKLKRIDTSGGTAQVLADANLGRGGSWNRDDVIIFTPSPNAGIWRVPAAGGSPTAVTSLDTTGSTHVYPQFLPDGRRFVYYQRSDKPETQGIYLRNLDSSEATLVLRNSGLAVPVPGYLLLVREGTLFAQPVDDATFQTRGDPVRLADGIGYTLGTIGYSPVSATATTLAYGPMMRLETALQWRDRSGASVGPAVARGDYRSPRLSGDGQRVVLSLLEEKATSPDIWMLDLTRGTFTRVSHDPATDWFPVWMPDGRRVLFGSARSRATNIFQSVVGSTAQEEALLATDTARYPMDATSDERVVFQFGSPTSGYDLGMVELRKGRTPSVLLSSRYNEVQARVSPNQRWMAYASDESGHFEVYVRGFPSAGNQWTISTSGGMQPEWRRDGRELFYVSTDRKLMAVPVTTDGETFSAGVPQALFPIDIVEPNAPYPNDYAVSADGQRFLINTQVDRPSPPLTVVLNWAAGLKK